MSRATLTICVFFVILLSLDLSVEFNLDTRWPVIHNGPSGSEFGYAVDLHREQNRNWLLVGAPKTQTEQPGVVEGGAVWKCPVTPVANPGKCEEIIFDATGHPMSGDTQTGSKSNQRFGYTVKSSGPNGPVVACAPLRMWYTNEGRYRFPVGGCFVARNNFTDITEMKPCETEDNTQWKRLGPVYCQAGMSAVINQDMVVMGGPGSIYWQGGLYIDYFSDQRQDPLPFQDETTKANNVDDSYRGYSVTFGEFNGDGQQDLAVGLPRGPEHKGQVRLYSTDLAPIGGILIGEQVGCYFGHSLATVDLNNDGLDDLIVGAPMYINVGVAPEAWEAGRVYIYYQDENHSFGNTVEMFTGARKQARFGFSVAAIGDMDKDGFNDFAVGAPYDGEDGMGAVYIYHGRRKGLRISLAQTVYPSDLNHHINTFGYSLASGLDMDDNAYIDLLVGAYNASVVLLLRARPVVSVHVEFNIIPGAIDLDVKDKQLPDGSMVSKFMINTCLTFTGIDVPQNVELAFSTTLDSQHPLASRAVFTTNEDSKLSKQEPLEKDTKKCFPEEAYVKNNIRDRQTPIGIILSYSVPVNESSMQPSAITPILKQNADKFAYRAVPLINNCKNLLCLPDLRIKASTTTSELVIGGLDPIFIDVIVNNNGEDAFEAVFVAQIPVGLQFVRVERKQSDVSVTCNEDLENNLLVCDLGNPFPENHEVAFGIKLDNIALLGDYPEANISMEVKSASEELQNTTADNFAWFTVNVTATADITFTGISEPYIYEVPATEDDSTNKEERDITTESDAGPEVTHYYMLRNTGPSNIGPTSIQIKWPMKNSENEYWLYLISATMGATGKMCEVLDGEFNPEGLKPDPDQGRTNGTGQAAAQKATEALRRKRRQAEAPEDPYPVQDIYCNSVPASCLTIRCVTDGLMAHNDKLDSVTIIVKSRLWLDTIAKMNIRDISLTSSAEARVLSMPYAIAPADLPKASYQVTIQAVFERLVAAPATAVPLWVYAVATMVGVFILCVIVLGLWKIGFFKRKKIQPNPQAMVSDDTWVEDILTVPAKK